MISEDEVKKLATLARLEIETDFVPVVTGHLNSILEYVGRLNEIDTSGIEPMSHVHGFHNAFREDICVPAGSTPPLTPLSSETVPVQETLPTQSMVQNAPDHTGSFIKVPLIVE
jgi:aspartyl-tRNA(Asn)/glutamyl-tRNA(Gln) amidotransferase subunit C